MNNSLTKKTLAACLTALCISQITSCGPTATPIKDGPPTHDIDPSSVPDAVPKPEKQYASVNPNSYTVKGHTYKVLKTAKNYDKVGEASWYGTKFHGQQTSTTERYNMYAMTAASPELPLPTYVKVTNLENGKHVVVKVNDRGPFEKNRLLDLSYVAARKLGFAGDGTTRIRVTAIQPSQWQAQKASIRIANNTVKHKTSNYIQVGAFSNPQNAKKVSTQIASITKTKKVYVGTASKNKHTIYRVEIGPITNTAENKRLRILLANNGYTVAPTA